MLKLAIPIQSLTHLRIEIRKVLCVLKYAGFRAPAHAQGPQI